MLGLVLEGGGAKGSYQAGAIKALYEKGYKFDGVMGTSIGAINGAFVAQGTEEKCFDFWENISPSKHSLIQLKNNYLYLNKKQNLMQSLKFPDVKVS